MADAKPLLTIGELARQAGMRASRIRYYERRGVLPEPARVSGMRRYSPDVVRRLAIIDLAQHVGFTLDEISELFGPDEHPPHDRIRVLAIDKLPEIEDLIHRAETIRRLLVTCAVCKCESLDECRLFDDRAIAQRFVSTNVSEDYPSSIADIARSYA
jgi:DNA-binding transcriptional MerR regulator